MTSKLISLVIPVFNEQDGLSLLLERLNKLQSQFESRKNGNSIQMEWILVDDGSSDESLNILKKYSIHYPNLRIVSFSRNFGQQMAVLAGLEFAEGDYVAVLDADLQDPPEYLIPMFEKLVSEKWDCVYGRRKKRAGESWFKILTANIFYNLMLKLSRGRIPKGVGDFRIMRSQVVEAILACSEVMRFNRGLFAWVGFKQAPYDFDRPQRTQGSSSYIPIAMFRLAWSALVSHTDSLIRVPWIIGLAAAVLGIFFYAALGSGSMLTLFSYSLVAVSLFTTLAIFGEYLIQVHWELKRRPNYIVSYFSRIQTVSGYTRSGGYIVSEAIIDQKLNQDLKSQTQSNSNAA